MAEKTSHTPEFVQRIGITTAYGDPVDVDGTTILPVAAAAFCYGSGGSNEAALDENESGDDIALATETSSGAGGGGYSLPLGAYVTRDGYTRFEPNTIALAAVAIPVICVAGRALARIIRALKK